MQLQTTFLLIAGSLTVLTAVLHIGIPLFRGWYRELKQLSVGARRTVIDRNSFLILIMLITAYLCFALPDDMRYSQTGRALLLMLGIFWIVRGLWRWFGFPEGKLRFLIAPLYAITGVMFILALMP